ncbi:MAG: hypothetical protein F6K03_15645 [Kamptonema sp. SIO4C4]|nr:hypothetical protein [Kamptonema sp. SIO4C4]
MFVFDLSVDQWVRNKDEGVFIENPTWQQIEGTICQLNGETQTLVTLGADEASYMSIGGGQANQYIVNVTFDGMTFYNLVDPAQPEQIKSLVIGGQLGNYPAKLCTDLPTALKAARTFAESGELEDSVRWEDGESLVMVG